MDRITRIRIENVRAIEHIDLEVSRPLTVLIGENGSGKSTILECLELLRKAAEQRFMEPFYAVHRGLPAMLRKGARSMTLGVVVEDDTGKLPRIEYAFTLGGLRAGAVVQAESMLIGPTETEHAAMLPDPALALVRAEVDTIRRTARRGRHVREKRAAALQLPAAEKRLAEAEAASQGRASQPLLFLNRTETSGEMFDASTGEMSLLAAELLRPDQLALTAFGNVTPNRAIDRLIAVLQGIEVHLDFDSRASWAVRSYQRPETLRASVAHFPAPRLNLLGVNLANAWSELRNRDSAHWEYTMFLVRQGLGSHVDSVVVQPDMGGGNVYLALRLAGASDPLYAADLSDGQLAWLAFVAMVRLNPRRTLLAVDEPELHLHPQLLAAVVSLLRGAGVPVVVATHSDRLLELLDDPAKAVRVATLDEAGVACLARLDPGELARWLTRYGDLGQIRAAGHLGRVLAAPLPPEKGDVA